MANISNIKSNSLIINFDMEKNIAHILIIEDEPDIIELSHLILKSMRYVVSSARNGEAGLEKLER